MTRIVPPLALAFGLVATPSVSLAAPAFDTETGKFSTDGAAYALSFDDLASIQGLGLSGYDVFNDAAVDELQVGARIVRDEPGSIEGEGALGMGGDYMIIQVPLGGAATGQDALVGRRVEVSLWQKANGTRVTPSMSWYAGDPLDPMYLGTLTLQPTGEVTDDGWERWTSGPFDWAWAAAVGPASIDFYDEAFMAYYGGAFPDAASRALVDALTIVDLGPAAVPAATCALPTESSDCGDEGLCHLGRCVDAAIRVGQAIQGDEHRADYIDRRLFEVRTFEGGRAPRAGKVELVNAALLPLKDKANSRARTFWPTFSDAYTLLVDGHASAPVVNYAGAYQNAGVCVHEGVADLLDGAPVVPLVFQPGSSFIGAQLQEGDALVAIDGIAPAQWASMARRLVVHAGDPEGRSVVTAPTLFNAAIDAGSVVTFQRCSGGADGVTPCAAGDVEEISIDLGALVGDAVLAGETPLGYEDVATCDYRFVRPVQSNDRANTDYAFAGFDDEGGIRTLVINGVPGYSNDTEAWFTTVEDALAAAASRPDLLILDQRTGSGGGVDAVDWLSSGLIDDDDLFAMDFLSSFEGDDFDADRLAQARAAVVSCSLSQQSYTQCGNSFRVVAGDVSQQGSHHAAAANAKLAVLNAMDVSGNDYTSKMIRSRDPARTRFFGAGAAFGAYGVIWGLSAHFGELSGGSIQVQDTIFIVDEATDDSQFSTSTGERPDVVVRQTQSDAIAGRDTVLEAARAWLQASEQE